MPTDIILAIFFGLPLVLITLFRVKPLYVFVSLVTGYFWMMHLSVPAELILRSLVHVSHADIVARVVLLLIPFVLTLFLMKKTLSTNALPFMFFLLVANSLLLVTFLIPILTPGVQGAIYETNAGRTLRQSHEVLIVGVATLHVVVMWVMKPSKHNRKKH